MAFITGFILGLTLILGIGPQNIFVLKQAMKKHYAASTAAICFGCDMILIIFSISLTTTMVKYLPTLRPLMLSFAIIFLLYYGIMSIKSSYNIKRSLDNNFTLSSTEYGFIKILILSMSFSLLNPQAILDIVVLLGGYASKYKEIPLKIEFMLGASSASLIWFFSLILVGTFLSKFIQKNSVWCWLERITGALMFIIAINCILLLFKR